MKPRITTLTPTEAGYTTPVRFDYLKVMLRCRPIVKGLEAETPWAEVMEVDEQDKTIIARIDNHVAPELHGYSVHEEVTFRLEKDADTGAEWWTADPKPEAKRARPKR